MKIFLLFFVMLSVNCFGQNVGIGTSTPGGKLQVNSNSNARPNLLITDSAYKAFGLLRFNHVDYPGRYMQLSGYKAMAATAETYMSISSDSVPIISFRGNGNVSINNAGAVYPLNVAGDVDIAQDGALRLNGNSGTAGQVLTSGGEGQPSTWTSQAFTQNTRFFVRGTISASTSNIDSLPLLQTRYNTNPSSITISPKHITINKAGLYHFETGLNSTTTITTSETATPALSLNMTVKYPGNPFPDHIYLGNKQYIIYNSSASFNYWIAYIDAKWDIYFPAGTTIALSRSALNTTATNRNYEYTFSGYLISD